ncbi:MAG: hypothetical protein UX80_C0034G0001, partial [Candidatus Amesbacteria bacterium GW2011_GWA2_47_11b]
PAVILLFAIFNIYHIQTAVTINKFRQLDNNNNN